MKAVAPRLTNAFRRLGASTPTRPMTGTAMARTAAPATRPFELAVEEKNVLIGLKPGEVERDPGF